MVKDWAECWDIEKNRVKDKEKYRLFHNTKQGLTFEDSGVQIDYERAIQYRRSGFVKGSPFSNFATAHLIFPAIERSPCPTIICSFGYRRPPASLRLAVSARSHRAIVRAINRQATP
jgi:hypothetical protein